MGKKSIKLFWKENKLSLSTFILVTGAMYLFQDILGIIAAIVFIGLLVWYYRQDQSLECIDYIDRELEPLISKIWTELTRQMTKENLDKVLDATKTSAKSFGDSINQFVNSQQSVPNESDVGAASVEVLAGSTEQSGVAKAEVVSQTGEKEVQINASEQPEQNQVNYNKPEEAFKLKKKGRFLNALIYIICLGPLFYLLSGPLYYVPDEAKFGLLVGAFLFLYIYLLPTFICHTGAKFFIFIFNAFFGITIIGWVILLFWATNSNKAYDKEQEMNYLLRKVSDKL